MQIQRRFDENFGIGNTQFVSEDIRTFNNAVPVIAINSGQTFDTRSRLFSLFGGFNYDFDNRYLVSATLRRDGSSVLEKTTSLVIFQQGL